MKRWLVPSVVLAVVGVGALWYVAPELGIMTPHHDAFLSFEETTTPDGPLHLDALRVEQEAPALYELLEEALEQGQSSTGNQQKVRAAWGYLSDYHAATEESWNGHDIEWRGRFFLV